MKTKQTTNPFSCRSSISWLIIFVVAVLWFFTARSAYAADKYALVIGINDYQVLSKLEFCSQDAEAVRQVLVKRAGFSPEKVVLLTDSATDRQFQPTWANLKRRMKLFTRLPKPDDMLLIFFAGHGITVDGKAYLVPQDGDGVDTAISLEWVRDLVDTCEASTKVLILDACHSGKAARGLSGIAPDLAVGPALLVLTSCAENEISFPDQGQGLFTRYLVEGLRGKADANRNREVTGVELHKFIRTRVAGWCLRTGKTQTPQMLGGAGKDLVLAHCPKVVSFRRDWDKDDAVLDDDGQIFAVKCLACGVSGQMTGDEYAKRKGRDFAICPWCNKCGLKVTSSRSSTTTRTQEPRPVPRPTSQGMTIHRSATSAKVKQVQTAAANALGVPVTKEINLGGGVKMKFALIPAGEFMMGSNHGTEDEGPVHPVKITQPFYMGMHEVTVGQFRRFVSARNYRTNAERGAGAYIYTSDKHWRKRKNVNWTNPGYTQADSHPVSCVSWDDAQAFCTWLSATKGVTSRLPTEAEWEYACRAGSRARFCFGDNASGLAGYAWYDSNSSEKTHPVGRKKSNAFGLYDMHGNVWEWCQDWYGSRYYVTLPKVDPPGPESARERVMRGGSWGNTSADSRCGRRHHNSPTDPTYGHGFRVVCIVKQERH